MFVYSQMNYTWLPPFLHKSQRQEEYVSPLISFEKWVGKEATDSEKYVSSEFSGFKCGKMYRTKVLLLVQKFSNDNKQ